MLRGWLAPLTSAPSALRPPPLPQVRVRHRLRPGAGLSVTLSGSSQPAARAVSKGLHSQRHMGPAASAAPCVPYCTQMMLVCSLH